MATAQIKFQLIQPQRETAIAIALIKHHLFRIHGPAFDKHAGLQDAADQRRIAVRILQLHVVSRIRFVDGQHLQHVHIVLFQKTADAIFTPV